MIKTLFFTYFPFLQHLFFQSVSNAVFSSCLYEAPLSEKQNVLWLVWPICCDWSTASEMPHLLP